VKNLALALLLVAPAAAQNADIDHETWSVIGWNDGCGVAYEHDYYPKLGAEMTIEPIASQIGSTEIPPGEDKSATTWILETSGRLSWDARAAANTVKQLKNAGYTRPGFPETIQDGPVGAQPGLADTILSTSTLKARVKTGWPGPDWRWTGGSYGPLGDCALLSFEKRGNPRHYRLILVRVYNARARRDRAYAHAANARLLFDAGSLTAAAPEAETASRLDPDLPIARYENAAMLALTGNPNEAVDELTAAVKLDPKFAKKASEDIDFSDLKERQDFQELTK
jgi:tetratricopeptide (TPR) repeat protein